MQFKCWLSKWALKEGFFSFDMMNEGSVGNAEQTYSVSNLNNGPALECYRIDGVKYESCLIEGKEFHMIGSI